MDTEDITNIYRLDEVLTNFYELTHIDKIQYAQYLPPGDDDYWSVRMELTLRQQNTKTLVALLSKELWCFSINDDPLPIVPMDAKKDKIINDLNSTGFEDPLESLTRNSNEINTDKLVPNKIGHFNADYSKPNLPPHYALFLKALKKSIYIELSINSQNNLIQFGNACISLMNDSKNESSNNLLQIEPHLFADGTLTITTCIKDLGLLKLTQERLQDKSFLDSHALYLAPSGIRMSLIKKNNISVNANNKPNCNTTTNTTTDTSSIASTLNSSLVPNSTTSNINMENNNSTLDLFLVSSPDNADILLESLSVFHGIKFDDKKSIKWIEVKPNIGILSGNVPTISRYLEPIDLSNDSNIETTVIWPLDLCFAQPQFNVNNKNNYITNNATDNLNNDLQDVMNIIDDFIQIKQTSAYRTPGSIGNLNTNPMSSGGGYTEQFQQFYKHSTGNNNNTLLNNVNNNMNNSNNNSAVFNSKNLSQPLFVEKLSPFNHSQIQNNIQSNINDLITNPMNKDNLTLLNESLNQVSNVSTPNTLINVSSNMMNLQNSINNIPVNNELFQAAKRGLTSEDLSNNGSPSILKNESYRKNLFDSTVPKHYDDPTFKYSNNYNTHSNEHIISQELENSNTDNITVANSNNLDNIDTDMNEVDNNSTNENDEIDDNDLFGDDDDDDDDNDDNDDAMGSNEDVHDNLFDGSQKNISQQKANSDEITEDMFGLSDDDDDDGDADVADHMNIEQDTSIENDMKNNATSLRNIDDDTDSHSNKNILTEPNMKRKYLDIPIDEMTLSNSPFYTDPGAPLPVETPRDKRKSVFAPLLFNPKILNSVDNKYKNGGKFSFSPQQKDEPLNFTILTADVSSSEDDDTDSSFESFDYSDEKPDLKQLDIHEPQLLNYPPPLSSTTNESLPPWALTTNYNAMNEPYNKEGSNSIWKIAHSDLTHADSPLKAVYSISPTLPPTELDNFSRNDPERKFNKETPSTDVVNIGKNGLATPGTFDSNITNKLVSVNDENRHSKQKFGNLPFILRHVPLSSIPDVFINSNPVMNINLKNQEILDIICEQIVFDYDMLENLKIPEYRYDEVLLDENGFIFKTLKNTFSDFKKVYSNKIIDKIYPNKQPFVLTKKQHECIKVKSDTYEFNKFLNLKPYMGIKNFKFLLLTTPTDEDCKSFISTLSQTYTNQEFGFCELLKLTPSDTNGLVCLKDFEKSKLLLLAAQIVTYCSTNKKNDKDTTLMIILPLKNNTLENLLSNITVYQTIHDEVRAKIPNIDLLLKVVPLDFIKNPLTSVDDYYNLCSSIYNILWPKWTKLTTIAHKLPDKITFRTSKQTNGLSFIDYDSYIHLAYSRSVDRKWIFGVLSDSTGKESMIKSWYVGDSKTLFDNSCTQLWAMAIGLGSKKYGKICLILTRLNGVLPDDELMNWRRLSGRNVHLAVVCVDDNTKISFYDENKLYSTFKPILKDDKYAENLNFDKFDDYEIRNIDEDIHSVIFQNPFPLGNSQHRCAIKSGALIKFKRTSENSVWDKFEVNLLNCPHSDSYKLLEIILREFRNLAALNSWFGVSNGENSHIPWHVLAVKKMMRTLVHIQVNFTNKENI